MTDVALIFPGQGAQKPGMGREFYESSPVARDIFDRADRILGNDLSAVILNGPAERLTETAFCQPAILTFSIAAWEALRAHPKFRGLNVRFTAGLSLGEYSALTAGGSLDFSDGLKLVERRSFFMEEAGRLEQGGMAAIIGFDRGRLQEICSQTGAQVANYNAPDQIVITGRRKNVEEAGRLIKNEGARAVIPLEVSGAFHSSLMQPAAEKFEKELQKAAIRSAQIAVVSNVDALPHGSVEDIRKKLARQIVSSVQWEPSVRFMANQGVTQFIEIGPGKVLKGLIRKIDSNLKVFNVETPQDIEQLP